MNCLYFQNLIYPILRSFLVCRPSPDILSSFKTFCFHGSLSVMFQLSSHISLKPYVASHQLSIRRGVWPPSLFCNLSNIGAWSECMRGRWFTYAVGYWRVHWTVATVLSSRSWIASDVCGLLVQVKAGPLYPRSINPASNKNCLNLRLFGFSVGFPPYFSSSVGIALKWILLSHCGVMNWEIKSDEIKEFKNQTR